MNYLEKIGKLLRFPQISVIDILEMLIIAFVVYEILFFVKSTRAWNLFKGIAVLLLFTLLAAIFQMNTILWIAERALNVGIIAMVVVFQPELRRALEHLGKKQFILSIMPFESQRGSEELFTDKTRSETVKAVYEMARVKTGALIVIEQNIKLEEYIRTGIALDSLVSSQLYINIFEHNTPLHDGAVIVRGNRVVSATCYLPLTDNMELSKELGTRHRAAVGVSEVSDSLTIIVSEETGKVSVAYEGVLIRNVDAERLNNELIKIQHKNSEDRRFKFWRGRQKDAEKADK